MRLRGHVLGGLVCASLVFSVLEAEAATRYIFTTFRSDEAAGQKLFVYTSEDGLNFSLFADTGYGGPTGVLRDPTIMKHTDGKYYIAYTVQSWTTNSNAFGIASSTDLRNWSFLTEVPAGIQNPRFTWAPEWFKDSDGIHLIVSLTSTERDADFRSYDFKAKDDTLKAWDAPVPIGIGPNNIDTFIVKAGATYHAFSKNETTKFIERATSAALHGPWTWVGKDDWAGWGSGKEGIALFQLDDSSWRMFLDCYGGCGFLHATSTDLTNWSEAKTVPGGLSGMVRHGTVLREAVGSSGGSGMGGGGASTAGGNGGGTDGGGTARPVPTGGSVNGGRPSLGGSAGTGGKAASGSGGTQVTGGASSGGGAGTSSGGAALVATGGSNPGSGGTGGAATPKAGATASGGTTASGGAAPAPAQGSSRDDGGCSYAGGAAHGARWLALFGAVWLLRRARKR